MPTTNQTSRAPNKNTRAALSQFTLGDFENTSENFVSLRPFGSPGGMAIKTASRIAARIAAMPKTAQTNPSVASKTAPSRNPAPFTMFLDPVRIATQRKRAPSCDGASNLTADLDDILARSLATPLAPCTSITKATDVPIAQVGSSCAKASRASTCNPSPAYSVDVRPNRAAIQPAQRLVMTPAIS